MGMTLADLFKAEKKLVADRYIRERGLQIIYGSPSPDEKFPFLVLKKPLEKIPGLDWSDCYQSGISYVTDSKAWIPRHGARPGMLSTDECIDHIVDMIGVEGKEFDGEAFFTKPGQPIKVFVMEKSLETCSRCFSTKV